MENNTNILLITARIYLRLTSEGGRQSPIKSGYRPNHVFELQQDLRRLQTYIGEIRFNDVPLIYPGDIHLVTIAFLRMPQVEKHLQPGKKWWIYEVPKLVAEGEILSILNLCNIRKVLSPNTQLLAGGRRTNGEHCE